MQERIIDFSEDDASTLPVETTAAKPPAAKQKGIEVNVIIDSGLVVLKFDRATPAVAMSANQATNLANQLHRHAAEVRKLMRRK